MASQKIKRTLADNIRHQLLLKGWTQTELARRCGWAPSRLGEILAEKYDPRLGTIEKLASALGLKTRELLMPYVEEEAVAHAG